MKKRRILTGVVTLMSVVTLAACSQNSSDTKIVTMKGDTITVGDFYDKVKSSSASKQALLSMIIQQVFEKAYGDKVTDKEVTDAYNKAAEYYGDSFETVLSQQGYTKDDYKAQIRSQKLVEYAVKKEAEKNITTTDYKNAYKSYTMFNVDDIRSEDYIANILSQDIVNYRKELYALKPYKADYQQALQERDRYKAELEEMVVRYNSVTHSRRWTIPTKLINLFRRRK